MNKVHYCYEISIYGEARPAKVYDATGVTDEYAITPCGNYTSFSNRVLIGKTYTFEIPDYEPPTEQIIEALESYAKRTREEALAALEKRLDPIVAKLTELKAIAYNGGDQDDE